MRPISPPTWSRFDARLLQSYAVQRVKLAFVATAVEMYVPEAGRRGIDLLVTAGSVRYLEVKVCPVRQGPGIAFIPRPSSHGTPAPYMALVLFDDWMDPAPYLIPPEVVAGGSAPFTTHFYRGVSDPPEATIDLTREGLAALEPYRLERVVDGWRRADGP